MIQLVVSVPSPLVFRIGEYNPVARQNSIVWLKHWAGSLILEVFLWNQAELFPKRPLNPASINWSDEQEANLYLEEMN